MGTEHLNMLYLIPNDSTAKKKPNKKTKQKKPVLLSSRGQRTDHEAWHADDGFIIGIIFNKKR